MEWEDEETWLRRRLIRLRTIWRFCVEQALADDPELAPHYDLVRQELAETIHLNERLGAPSARAMEKLFTAIDAEEAGTPRRRRRRISRPLLLGTAST
jgi:hypothetical protein